jgi:3-dehydrosphinganine reductase
MIPYRHFCAPGEARPISTWGSASAGRQQASVAAWCGRWDSNPHRACAHQILSLAPMPIRLHPLETIVPAAVRPEADRPCILPSVVDLANGFTDTVSVITGASKGIGRATAREVILRGGSVVLVARGSDALQETASELSGLAGAGQSVDAMTLDATDPEQMSTAVGELIEERGTPHHLINCVGGARPGYLRDLTLDDYRSQLEVNYLSQLIPTIAIVPHMIEAGRGHISLVSSMMGYFGMIGYGAYAPAKFAVVGLAEVLRHELKPAGIGVSVLFPPDTDTPGFANENKTKPTETAIMSETAGLLAPEAVARTFIEGILAGRYSIHPKGSGWIWRMNRYAPGLVRMVMDRDLRKAMRKAGTG